MYLSCAPHSQPEKTQKPDSRAWLNTNPPERMGGARACFFFNVPPFGLVSAPMQQPASLSYHRAADSQPVSLQPPPPHQLFPACLPQEITLPPSGHARPGQACLHMKTRSRWGRGRQTQPDMPLIHVGRRPALGCLQLVLTISGDHIKTKVVLQTAVCVTYMCKPSWYLHFLCIYM